MRQPEAAEAFGKIAVVGMVCRFPHARNTEEFWDNLAEGKECITFSSEQELIDRGVDSRLVKNPHFVRAYGIYEDTYLFDAPFFGFTPREGELLDPQHRVFLECAWEALENAGYDSNTYHGRIGVFAGASHGRYLVQLANDAKISNSVGIPTLVLANEKDFLATRVGYKLNLKGPCVTVQTACSTSLVAIVMACQNLLNYQSDMVLAGGITLDVDHLGGYYHEEGGIVSPDGHCRAFDADAKGTVPASGVGVVVLKRLEDALVDRDTIHAVIIGSGMCNDGSAKVGFTAPSVDGQVPTFLEAIAMAGINPETVNFIECHGTGTSLGDPIEIAALTKAFRSYTDKKGFCAVGSVKSNLGHTDTAAGVAGFIKTVLALKHKQIPPTLHVANPNPTINFEETPFYPNIVLSEWKQSGPSPRRAGQNSFGMGGTNAHVLLEEAPQIKQSSSLRPYHLLVWSAKTSSALEAMTANLAEHLKECADDSLADLAFTLQTGRALFSHRRMLVCRDCEDAGYALDGTELERLLTATNEKRSTPVGFLFPGQGAQFPNMGRQLYELDDVFREQVDLCAVLAKPHLGYDIRELLYPSSEQSEQQAQLLNQTANTQPALFVIEYALAKLWMKWGVKPDAMIGHSIGEYVAACLAGVFSLEDALLLVCERGRLMQALPPGAMVSIMLPEQEILPLLAVRNNCCIAAVNADNSCVVSGEVLKIEQLEAELGERGIGFRRLQTSHAFHSSMMDPILEPFRKLFKKIKLNAPQLRYISNLSGNWITTAEATEPDYWVRHLRHTVRFADGAGVLFQDAGRVLLEVGPGRALSSLVARHPQRQANQQTLPSLPSPQTSDESDFQFLLATVGRLWLEGVAFDWRAFYENEERGRIPAPTYPFERQTYRAALSSSLVRNEQAEKEAEEARLSKKKEDLAEWFYSPSWKRCAPLQPKQMLAQEGLWLLFLDGCGVGLKLAERLNQQGQDVIPVFVGKQFRSEGQRSFTIDPGNRDHYVALIGELRRAGKSLANIVHLWGVTSETMSGKKSQSLEESLNCGFYSLLFLIQALGTQYAKGSIQIFIVANDMHDVSGEGVACPVKATVLGLSRSIPREYQQLHSRMIDLHFDDSPTARDEIVECLLREFSAPSTDELVAYRGGHRWIPIFEPLRVETSPISAKLREQGVYLITGGLGGIGLVLAEHLALTVRAKLALVGRSRFPEKSEWDEWLSAHETGDPVSKKILQLKAIEALGAQVLVCNADVADRAQMCATIERVKEQYGAIHGVIHSAGVAGNGIIDLKTREMALKVLAPKVHGTLVLDELLQEEQLDFFILCSSLAAFFGAAGQSDYAGANAFLDAFAHSCRHREKNVPLSINWDRWNEVGMAVDALPAQQKSAVAGKQTATHPPLKLKSGRQPFEHPVFTSSYMEGDAEIFSGQITPAEHWLVGEHRVKGIPTLVGTSYMELARSVLARKLKQPGAIEVRDLVFFTPLMMQDGQECELQLVLKPLADGFEFRIRSSNGNAEWQEHARARIHSAPDQNSGDLFDIPSLLALFGLDDAAVKNSTPLKIDESHVMQLGPRWQCLMSVSERPNEALARLKLADEFVADLGNFELHPALLDCATSFALGWAVKGSMYLPCSYERVTIYKPLSAEIYCYARYTPAQGPQDEVLTVDIDVVDTSGELLVAVNGCSFKRVREATLKSWDKVAGGTVAAGDSVVANQQETPFGPDAWGILSKEGAEAFVRSLSLSSTPQIAVSSVDPNWIAKKMKSTAEPAHSEAVAMAPALAAGHPRPDLPTAYVAPRTELEQSIADIWQSLLGIAQIGVLDDFVELGGHSLLATQVVSRIREIFEIDLPTARFYENPTIAGLAEAVVQATAAQADSEKLMLALQEINPSHATEEAPDKATLVLK
jgi:phthiocerol/phenolphthiocerol synthesis type-I polyketide synthase E